MKLEPLSCKTFRSTVLSILSSAVNRHPDLDSGYSQIRYFLAWSGAGPEYFSRSESEPGSDCEK
jgi:hypothetical protein